MTTFDSSQAFTLYGALDPTAERQAIRVIPIRERLELPGADSLEADVRIVDVRTGEVFPLRDSLVTRGGAVAHVFVGALRPEYGQTYRVEAERPADGVVTSAVVDVPPAVEGVPQAPVFRAGGVVWTPVLWPGAPVLLRGATTYTIEDAECNVQDVPRPFNAEFVEEDGGVLTRVQFSDDAEAIADSLGEGPALIEMTMRVQVANAAWVPPGGAFNPEALVEPGTFSNVENGFGFVGAAYFAEVTWRPQDRESPRARGDGVPPPRDRELPMRSNRPCR